MSTWDTGTYVVFGICTAIIGAWIVLDVLRYRRRAKRGGSDGKA